MSTITKQLSRDELRAKLDKGGMISRRPDLAYMILSGQSAYEERAFGQSEGENYALKGSPAAYATKDLKPEPMLSRAEPGISDAEAERRMEEIRLRHASSGATRSVGVPTVAPVPASDPSEEFIKAAKQRAAKDALGMTGDPSADLLNAVRAGIANEQRGLRLVDDPDPEFNPFDFGGAA